MDETQLSQATNIDNEDREVRRNKYVTCCSMVGDQLGAFGLIYNHTIVNHTLLSLQVGPGNGGKREQALFQAMPPGILFR